MMNELAKNRKTYAAHNSTVLFDCQVFRLTEHTNGRYYLILKEFQEGDYVPKRGNDVDKIQRIVFDILYENKGATYDDMMEQIKKALSPNRTGFYYMGHNDKKLKFYYDGEYLGLVPKGHRLLVEAYCKNELLNDMMKGRLTILQAKEKLNEKFDFLHLRTGKNNKRINSEEQMRFVLDNSFNEKLQQELDEKDSRIIDLERKIDTLMNVMGSAGPDDFALVLMLKRWVRNFTCQLCGGSLVITHVKDKNGNRKQNVGRIAMGCTGYKYYSHSSCQSFRFANELDYLLLHDEIEQYIRDNPGTYVPHEYVKFYDEYMNICNVFRKRLEEN